MLTEARSQRVEFPRFALGKLQRIGRRSSGMILAAVGWPARACASGFSLQIGIRSRPRRRKSHREPLRVALHDKGVGKKLFHQVQQPGARRVEEAAVQRVRTYGQLQTGTFIR